MSGKTELLPCPFCGGEAEVIEAGYGMYMTGYAVYCKKCCLKLGVTGRLGETYEWSPVFDTEAEAIAAWNTRATSGTLTAEQVREAIERHVKFYEGGDYDEQEIADELNTELRSDRHAYEQRITGDGSDWGEIMRNAYDDLIATACESCTPEQMERLADYIRAELGSERGTCHAESDLSEWVCSRCQCWIPLGLTPENIKHASEWRYCPHCGARVEVGE